MENNSFKYNGEVYDDSPEYRTRAIKKMCESYSKMQLATLYFDTNKESIKEYRELLNECTELKKQLGVKNGSDKI